MSFRFLGALLATLLLLGGAASANELKIRDLYNKDMSFSQLAHGLEGQAVVLTGFMAPPLKAEATFFVLTKRPMSTCPFCELEAEWPDDILAIYTERVFRVRAYNRKITVRGVLHLDVFRDPDTGFLSRARLERARVDD